MNSPGHKTVSMATVSEVFSAALEHYRAGRVQLADATCRQVIALAPDHSAAWHLLGLISRDTGNHDFAVECLERALQLNPGDPAAHNNLGILLKNQGKLDEAVACYARALQLKPDFIQACNNLGNAWQLLGRLDEAIASCRQAIQIAPSFTDAYVTLGNALKDQGKLDEAAASYEHALALNRNLPAAQNNLGHVLKERGQLDEAIACYRRAMELRPDFAAYHSNLAYTLNFHPGFEPRSILEEHRAWNRRHAEPLAKGIEPHTNDRSPERRLRVGYVSPDFRSHSVGRFMVPLLQAHDHNRLEVFCYSSVRKPDEYTASCQASASTWRNVRGMSDDQVAQTILRDRIDILVDLTMHMADNRLRVFALKPAPVQVTYLAYCGTTGLETIDYRLTDGYLDPLDHDTSCYSEQSIRLPETYWCYRPMAEAREVSSLPGSRNGYVTFGSLNNFCKVTHPALVAWSRLLHSVPESRLLLHTRQGAHRDLLLAFFEQQGILRQRIILTDWLNATEYFRLYDQIDLALDPFPYGGGTTTCDALWMGVPVVSLAGQTAVSRGGFSILSNLGLADLVAFDPDRYVEIAGKLAADLSRLAELRTSLRGRMQQSPLMDEPRFARNIEAAYRHMWYRWCAQ
jgi:predicted O-linked N-acetylglucosamine transferase (SPINDLY family)